MRGAILLIPPYAFDDVDKTNEFLLISNDFFSYGSTALYGPGPPRFVEASRSHTLDTPHSVGLLCTSDQPVADTST
jgi:hypothetical protein